MATVKDIVRLESSKLDINSIIESVVSPNCGAVSSFIGTTRDNFEQKKVVKLEYEAYEAMALKEMQAVCDSIRSKWNVEKIAIFHRLGQVPVTQASIVVAISSPHRQESLLAVQFAIDAVKTSVPIWKKEIYENDEPQWKENKECSWAKSDPIHQSEATNVLNNEKDSAKVDNESIIVKEEKPDFDDICRTVEVEATTLNESSIDTKCNDADGLTINPEDIQVKAENKEVHRRLESFMSHHRNQVNVLTLHAFGVNRDQYTDDDDESTSVCARVNAVFIRRHDSERYVKVYRVHNKWSDRNIKPALSVKVENNSSNYPPALEERLSTVEKILGVNKPVPRDVYERIKKLEDRITFLETISPEYFCFTEDSDSAKSFDGNPHDVDNRLHYKPLRKRTHSSTENGSKVHEFEDRYVKKAK